MRTLAIACETLGIDTVQSYIEVWADTFVTLYYRTSMSNDEAEHLLARYCVQRLEEVLGKLTT